MSVIYSCVMDKDPKFARQALVWASSLLRCAKQDPQSIVVHAVENCHPDYQRTLRSMGIRTVPVSRVDARHPHSNKLTQLESTILYKSDHVVLCDCDIVFCDDISSWVRGSSIRAKLADMASLSPDQWGMLFSAAGLPLNRSMVRTMVDQSETLPNYCNGGLLIIPQRIFQLFRVAWPKWNKWLLARLDSLGKFAFFTDQISFTLACDELGLRVDLLPQELNFPTHLAKATPSSPGALPLVLHYHSHVDDNGLLLPSIRPSVNKQITLINNLILSGGMPLGPAKTVTAYRTSTVREGHPDSAWR